MENKNIEDTYSRTILKAIYFQILLYTFLTLSFFIALYDNPLIYYISMFFLYFLIIFYYLIKNKELKKIYKILLWVLIFVFPLIILGTYNIYHFFLFFLLKDPIGLEFNFNLQSFFMYFGFLTFFAIISEAIILIYYYKVKQFPTEESYGIWDYFLKEDDPLWKRFIILIALLSVASIIEEIIFRFLLINIGVRLGINLIILVIASAIIFGLAHYQNGGWLFTINSTFAGIFFALAFIELGFYMVWILHLFWNFLVLFQMLLPRILESKLKEKTKSNIIIMKF